MATLRVSARSCSMLHFLTPCETLRGPTGDSMNLPPTETVPFEINRFSILALSHEGGTEKQNGGGREEEPRQ